MDRAIEAFSGGERFDFGLGKCGFSYRHCGPLIFARIGVDSRYGPTVQQLCGTFPRHLDPCQNGPVGLSVHRSVAEIVRLVVLRFWLGHSGHASAPQVPR